MTECLLANKIISWLVFILSVCQAYQVKQASTISSSKIIVSIFLVATLYRQHQVRIYCPGHWHLWPWPARLRKIHMSILSLFAIIDQRSDWSGRGVGCTQKLTPKHMKTPRIFSNSSTKCSIFLFKNHCWRLIVRLYRK